MSKTQADENGEAVCFTAGPQGAAFGAGVIGGDATLDGGTWAEGKANLG
jgi:hypothetical protein